MNIIEMDANGKIVLKKLSAAQIIDMMIDAPDDAPERKTDGAAGRAKRNAVYGNRQYGEKNGI